MTLATRDERAVQRTIDRVVVIPFRRWVIVSDDGDVLALAWLARDSDVDPEDPVLSIVAMMTGVTLTDVFRGSG